MGSNRQSHGYRFLGPRSFAVLSCALALLAAQPIIAAGLPAAHTEIRLTRSIHLPADDLPATAENQRERNPRSTAPQTFLASWGSARHLHVLATVEILHRLLLAELRPALAWGHGPERHLASTLFAPLDLLSFNTTPLSTETRPDPSPLLWHSHECAFAIAHCLLPPPLA